MPWSLMRSRFSISLMPYRVRYRLSRRFNPAQGNSGHAKQNAPSRRSHRRSRQLVQYFGRSWSASLHPRQVRFSRRKPLQIPQFIPQGAMISGSNSGALIVVRSYRPLIRRIRTDAAWAWRPSAPAMLSIVSPIASRPVLEITCTVEVLVKWLTLSPE